MKKEQAEFGGRLRKALRNAGLGEGSKELADLVSAHGGEALSPQAVHRWIRGHSIPKPHNMRALAKALRIGTEQLYGDPPRSAGRVNEDRPAWTASARDQHAIDAYLALPAERRRAVRELIDLLGAGASRS